MESSTPAMDPMVDEHPEIEEAEATAGLVVPPTSSPSPLPAFKDIEFKFKYSEAKPVPEGVSPAEWNKIYTAADSRMYNKHGKSAINSKKYRQSKETHHLAVTMLEERREKAKKEASGTGGASSKASTPKPPAAQKSTQLRADTPGNERVMTSISESAKSEGRPRKAVSAAPSSKQGTPAPSSAEALPKMSPTKAAKSSQPKKKTKKAPRFETHPNTNSAKSAPGSEDESGSDDGGEYCLCHGPDNHRPMIRCDGGCDDWYHCECVGINAADATELVDRYICPLCKTTEKFTTYKPMCRANQMNGCRKAASLNIDPPSKYCSEEHKAVWARVIYSKFRQDMTPSLGGRLNVHEAAAIFEAVKTKRELDALGQKPKLPNADPNRPAGLDYLTDEEQKIINNHTARQAVLTAEKDSAKLQVQLLVLIEKRAAIASTMLDGKPICGYDARLSFNPAQFAEWKETDEGKAALSNKVLGPRTKETEHIDQIIDSSGEAPPVESQVPDECKSMCLAKKCSHDGWREIHRVNYLYVIEMAKGEFWKLQRKIDVIVEDAETREATKDHDAHNETIEYR
ncbi:PHD-finger domain-containing protein [Phlyctema vagabunda]|uniref:PHD-finger domain-containing protein n=1 Tax=Phlyctema vagabunda TaxID=108571 RepID=A0ABR4PTJ1_9HELO